MTIITIVNVRKTFESPGESVAHLTLADEALTPGFTASREIKGAVFREECHNGVKIVSIESIKDLFECFACHSLIAHTSTCFEV